MPPAPTEARQRVLETALRLFGARGYSATSLQAIADQLGVTKAAVYYHFRAKADLLQALADPFLERLEHLPGDGSEIADATSCRVVLGAYLDALVGTAAVAALLIGDPTVSAQPAAVECRRRRAQLRDRLARAGSPPAGQVQAACCLGAVQSAVFDFGDEVAAANRAVILDAGLRALGTATVSG